MSEPTRLLDTEGDPFGASLLRAGLDDAPPPGAKDAVFRSIQGALGVAAVATVAATATSASASASTSAAASAGTAVKMSAAKALVVKLGIAKTLGIVGLCSVTVVGTASGVRELARDRAAPPAAVPSASLAQPSDARAATPPANERTPRDDAASASSALASSEPPPPSADTAPPPKAQVSTRPEVAPPAVAAPPPSASALAAADPAPGAIASEPAGVTEVRSKLRSGDAAGALALLSAMQKQFGGGHMSEDRAVLTIEALAASGNTSAARTNADAFLAAHPSSPFASRVRTYSSNP
ncbi:MAG: hypothetical protein U0414_14860 [Polyangiaceae bacterium]